MKFANATNLVRKSGGPKRRDLLQLLVGPMMGRRDGLALGVGERLVDDLVEPLTVNYLDKGHTIRLVGNDPNGRRVLNADALAEIEVGLDLRGQLLLRIDHKGKRDTVLLGELFRVIA